MFLLRNFIVLLAPGGRVVLRLFAAPEKREDVDEVLRDFLGGRVPNLNVLKLRLGMAMERSTEEGVSVRDILNAVETIDRDLARLAQRVNWSLDHFRVIELYRDSAAQYCFPDEKQITELFCRRWPFRSARSSAAGTYPLAERCPIVGFERQS